MLSRRNFLKGMLATIASTAIARDGILQPQEEIEKPERTIFDMAKNTWRNGWGSFLTPHTFRFGKPVYMDRESGRLVVGKDGHLYDSAHYTLYGMIVTPNEIAVHFIPGTPVNQLLPGDVIHISRAFS